MSDDATFDFLVDIDEKLWVLAKQSADRQKITFREFVERALANEIKKDKVLRRAAVSALADMLS